MGSKIAKEIFIIVLLLIVVLFTIGILFYEFIPSKNENISSSKYTPTDKVVATLAEIQENGGIDYSKGDNTNSLLKSYSINKSDLSGYQSENYYESGKKDPFAEYSESVAEEVIKEPKVNTVDNNKVKDKNTVSNTVTKKEPNTTNTVTNTTTNNTTNTSSSSSESLTEYLKNKNKNTTKDQNKTDNNSSTGIYFEKKDSK